MADEPTNPQPDAGAQPADANSSGTAGIQSVDTEKRFTQADVDRVVDARLKRERDAVSARADRERQEAANRAAAAQGEWQKLAGQHEARVRDLEAAQQTRDAEVEAYRKELSKVTRDQVKSWPEKLRKALPETDDPLELSEAIRRLAPVADDLAAGGSQPMTQSPRPGMPAAPRPAGGMTPDQAARQAEIARLRARGGYAPS